MDTISLLVDTSEAKTDRSKVFVVPGTYRRIPTDCMRYFYNKEKSSPIQKIVLEDGVQVVEPFAFFCDNLSELSLPSSIEQIGIAAFYGYDPSELVIECKRGTFSEIYAHYLSPKEIVYTGILPHDTPQKNSFTKTDADLCVGDTVIIPEGIFSVESQAFKDNKQLKYVFLPDTVQVIGESAFENCANLSFVKLSRSLKLIGASAFSGCKSLVSIDLPENILIIGMYAFCLCEKLRRLIIPASVRHIGTGAFAYCNPLLDIEINGNDRFKTADGIFYNIDGSVLQANAFLEKVLIRKGSRLIGSLSFALTSVTQVRIPYGVKFIMDYAFYGCIKLEVIHIPKSVCFISDTAFENCQELTIYCEADSYAESFAKESGINFQYSKSDKLSAFEPKKYSESTSLDLSGHISIPSGAFHNNSLLKSILIPDVTIIGEKAFFGCTSLIEAITSDSITSIGNWAFANCKLLNSIEISHVNHIGDAAFAGVKNVRILDCCTYYRVRNGMLIGLLDKRLIWASPILKGLIVITNDVSVISSAAFWECKEIRKIEISSGIVEIGDWAFLGCNNLVSIFIPESVTAIGFDAFEETGDNFRIFCTKGSYAEKYAQSHNIPYMFVKTGMGL